MATSAEKAAQRNVIEYCVQLKMTRTQTIKQLQIKERYIMCLVRSYSSGICDLPRDAPVRETVSLVDILRKLASLRL